MNSMTRSPIQSRMGHHFGTTFPRIVFGESGDSIKYQRVCEGINLLTVKPISLGIKKSRLLNSQHKIPAEWIK